MIAIKNRSGKIDWRFSFRNRSVISGSKSIPEIFFQIDPRLKNWSGIKITDGMQNRGSIFSQKSISDFQKKIGSRNFFSDRSAIFSCKSRSRSRSKTIPEKSVSDFSVKPAPALTPRRAPSPGTPSLPER